MFVYLPLETTLKLMYDKISQLYISKTNVSEIDLAYILSKFKPFSAKKHDVLIHKGEQARYFYFINKGCLRAYYVRENGSEATRYIAMEGQFGTALASFISGLPAKDYFDAVEDCELLRISREDFNILMKEILAFEALYLLSLELNYLYNVSRIASMMSMDAAERYQDLIQHHPLIIQRLPNKIVASYLGIAPESLSRLKAQK
jgi:CRP-like cAMP-binding protein